MECVASYFQNQSWKVSETLEPRTNESSNDENDYIKILKAIGSQHKFKFILNGKLKRFQFHFLFFYQETDFCFETSSPTLNTYMNTFLIPY